MEIERERGDVKSKLCWVLGSFCAGYDLVIHECPSSQTFLLMEELPDCQNRRPELIDTFSHCELFMNQLRVKVRIICFHMGSSWRFCSKNVHTTYSTLFTSRSEFPHKSAITLVSNYQSPQAEDISRCHFLHQQMVSFLGNLIKKTLASSSR